MTLLPDDLEIAVALGRTRFMRNDFEGAIAAFEEASRRDPKLAVATYYRGLALVRLGNLTGAEAAFHACLEISPASTSCLGEIALNDESTGRCDEEEVIAHRLAALDPDAPVWRALEAQAIVAQDPTTSRAQPALEAAWARAAPNERRRTELWNRTSLDILKGDFTAADADARAWEEEVASSPEAREHVLPALTRMWLALETGERARAASLADAYVARHAAWTTGDYYWDPAIQANGIRYRAGALDRRAFATLRERWLRSQVDIAERSGSGERGTLWLVAYAMNAVTPEDATEALHAAAAYAPLPAALDVGLLGARPMGETFRLAGRIDDAVTWLAYAAATCQPLELPIQWILASYDLGLTLEANRDARSACVAYAKVLRVWGRAVPRSITGERARQRTAALRCARE
jgi:hypothetical protein